MKVGDEYNCPKCGSNTFVTKESVMDGWSKVGEIFACASCSAKISDIEEKSDDPFAPKTKSEASNALASLLDTDFDEKLTIESTDEEKQFCRDCKHFVSHPFMDRCGLHEKDVNPMDDCPDFKIKKQQQ